MITADQAKAGAIIVGVAAVGFVAYKIYQGAGDALETGKKIVTEDLNPASTQNLIYKGVNALTGGNNETDSLGTRTYDLVESIKNWFNPPPITYRGGIFEDQRTADLFKSQNDAFK